MELRKLMEDYNEKLARYYKMEAWERNASHGDQLKLKKNIQQVIDDCSMSLNKVQQLRTVTLDEVIKGFTI